MAKYNGNIELIDGIKPKNGGTFPLMNAHDIQTNDDGLRLDEDLASIHGQIDKSVGFTPQELTGEQQTQARTNISAAAAADVEQLRSDVDGMFTGLISSEGTGGLTADDFTWGFVNGSTGAIAVQKNRTVTVDYLPEGVCRVECASPYKMRISAWEKEGGAFIGNWNGSGWANTSANHSEFDAFVPEYRYKICVLNPSNDVEYTDFSGAAASITLYSNALGGTADDVVDALRRKTVSGNRLVIDDSIAGAPMRCACEGPITLSGLNLSPVGEASFTLFKQFQFNPPLEAGTYTISARCESTDTDSEQAVIRVGNKWIWMLHDNVRHSAKFTLTEATDILYFYAGYNATQSKDDTAFWREIMIVSGAADKPYEPPVEPVTCDSDALVLMAQTNILTADSPMEITYIQRNEFVDSLLSATKSAELNAETLGYVTPEMLGAVGDGITDDVLAIQACIDLAAELKLPVRATRSYATTGSVAIGSNMDVEIRELNCTASVPAIRVDGLATRLICRKIRSQGVGFELHAENSKCQYNEFDLGSVTSGSHCVVLQTVSKPLCGNIFRFNSLYAGGDGCYCITTAQTGSYFNTENTFYGGICSNADWAYYGRGGNNKFYNLEVEGNIKGGFCFNSGANALIVGDRHAESMRDGEYPYIKITTPNGIGTSISNAITSLRYIAPIGMRINEIDIGEVAPYDTNDSGGIHYLQSNGSLGVIDCRIVAHIGTGENDAKVVQHFAERALIWGNCLIFQGVPEKYWQVTQSLDLRTITEDTPAMPTVFDIACANAEIYLHPSYCFMGIDRFEVIQTAEHTATVYDYFTGNVIFDGASLGAGEFEVRTYLNGNFARLDGENMIWKVRRLDGAKLYFSDAQPVNLTSSDLWFDIS